MRKIVLLVALGCALTACSPDDPDPAAPSPSVTVTPSANPSTDPLYLEAVDVYKKYVAELAKYEATSYANPQLPPELDQYISGSMKEAVQGAVKNSIAADSAPAKDSTAPSLEFAPNPGVQRADSETSIRVCVDSRQGTVVRRSTKQPIGSGVLAYKEIYFKRIDGVLKGFLSDAKQVQECPF